MTMVYPDPRYLMMNNLRTSTLLPRVSNTKEINDAPINALNSEEVYLDKSDDTVLYIRRVDSNGKSEIKRYRFYEDPELTQEQINDKRYVTIEQFNTFKDELLNAINTKQNYGKGKYNGNKSTNENV